MSKAVDLFFRLLELLVVVAIMAIATAGCESIPRATTRTLGTRYGPPAR